MGPEVILLRDDEVGQDHYPNVLRAILAMPWAIDHDSVAWAAIVDVLALRSVGRGLTDEEISARIQGAQTGPRQGRARHVGIATLPVYGVISPRQNMMARTSGGTTAESIGADFRAAMADPDVDGIVFDIDSPGGAMEGLEELAAEIRGARGTKPIVAVANHMAASAAYELASAADEIVATPSGLVGSIGVFTAHDDVSEAQAKLGIKRTVIAAGKHKAEGALGQALSDEARAHVQGQVNEFYSMMTSAIAKGRSYGGRTVGVDTVRGESWGEGRSVMAKAALAAGMIDSIDTLDNTVRRVARGIAVGQRTSALGGVDLTHDSLAALVSGLPLSERLALVSAQAMELEAHAREHADMRAKEGRGLSAATRSGLASLAASLTAIAGDPDPDGDVDQDDNEDEPASTQPTAGPKRRADLVIFEAATRSGYQLPH